MAKNKKIGNSRRETNSMEDWFIKGVNEMMVLDKNGDLTSADWEEERTVMHGEVMETENRDEPQLGIDYIKSVHERYRNLKIERECIMNFIQNYIPDEDNVAEEIRFCKVQEEGNEIPEKMAYIESFYIAGDVIRNMKGEIFNWKETDVRNTYYVRYLRDANALLNAGNKYLKDTIIKKYNMDIEMSEQKNNLLKGVERDILGEIIEIADGEEQNFGIDYIKSLRERYRKLKIERESTMIYIQNHMPDEEDITKAVLRVNNHERVLHLSEKTALVESFYIVGDVIRDIKGEVFNWKGTDARNTYYVSRLKSANEILNDGNVRLKNEIKKYNLYKELFEQKDFALESTDNLLEDDEKLNENQEKLTDKYMNPPALKDIPKKTDDLLESQDEQMNDQEETQNDMPKNDDDLHQEIESDKKEIENRMEITSDVKSLRTMCTQLEKENEYLKNFIRNHITKGEELLRDIENAKTESLDVHDTVAITEQKSIEEQKTKKEQKSMEEQKTKKEQKSMEKQKTKKNQKKERWSIWSKRI